MHTRLSTAAVCFWLALLAGQALVAALMRRSPASFLRPFLVYEVILGATLITLAKTVGAWTYFYCWVVGCFLHEGLSGALLLNLILAVKRRGLPSRQSRLPIFLAACASLSMGLYSAQLALSYFYRPTWKLLFSWEHAWWSALCCMVGLVPLYAWSISASLPRDLWLTLLGFGAHTVAQAGFFGLRIIRQHGFTHSSDVVYFAVLVLWLYASRSRGREMTQGHPQPLSNRLCESER